MLTIPNRPFATEKITGLMMPDGIFEITLGNQRLNAHFHNSGPGVNDAQVYIEGTSDPGIVVLPATQPLGDVASGASKLISWDLDLSGATPGAHVVSFVVDRPSGRTRVIKKIFVTRVTLDPSGTWIADVPEGRLRINFEEMAGVDCCGQGRAKDSTDKRALALAADTWRSIGHLWSGHRPDFEFCPPPYIPLRARTEVMYATPFDGQYGPLPFQDPFWKVVFCIIGVVLLIAAAIEEASSGTGSITVTAGGGTSSSCTTCGVGASGGGSSYAAAALLVGAATAFGIAAASDARDPWRRGQDATAPPAGEKTVSERVDLEFHTIDDVTPGTPFKAGLDWRYTRETDSGATYDTTGSDVNENVHVLSHYEIDAPNIYHQHSREPWIVRGRFEGPSGHVYSGSDLFVQCFLCGPAGQYVVIPMLDDGQHPDRVASDGWYTGSYWFSRDKSPRGIWTYFVVAQDMNTASTDLTPDEAAQIIGGQVLTGQLTLTFSGGTCPLVPDGHVNVV
jgi:hypothetical protein